MWPAEWRVFLYCGDGLPREAIRRGRRSMRGSTTLEGSGMVGEFEGGVDKGFILLLDSVIFRWRLDTSKYLSVLLFYKRDRRVYLRP